MTSPYLERRIRTYEEALNDTVAKLPTLQSRQRLKKIDGLRERGANIVSLFEFYGDADGLRALMKDSMEAAQRLEARKK